MFKSFILILFILLSGCAKTPAKKYVTNKTPTNQKKLTFDEIERNRAIETYRLLRIQDKKRKKARRNTRKKSRYKRKRYSRKKRIKHYVKQSPVSVKKIKPSYPKRDPEEIMIEINQNLSYFCMKKRKSKRFEDISECKLFAQERLLKCQEKHVQIDDARLVNCVKSGLRF
jgi:hypothetical protein